MKIRIQVVKVYELEIEAEDFNDVESKAYRMDTCEVEERGDLVWDDTREITWVND